MYKEMFKNIYQIKVPLPNNPLKELNSYLIKGDNRNLLVDVGFNRLDCKKILLDSLKSLEVDLQKTDVLITHAHVDHSGLASSFINNDIKIYMSKTDGNLLNEGLDEEYWEKEVEYFKYFGIDKEFRANFKALDSYKFKPNKKIKFFHVVEEDCIDIDGFNFRVVELPGHTMGMIGIYEINKKILFCGDHVLNTITPNIAFYNYDWDALGMYLKSLKKVESMRVEHIMTAHRNTIFNIYERILELYDHHIVRLDEVRKIIKKRKTVYQTACEMIWNMNYKSFDDFPLSQKWYASLEAAAHLEHLVHKGEAERCRENETYYYHLIN